jgi:hypothetical protein
MRVARVRQNEQNVDFIQALKHQLQVNTGLRKENSDLRHELAMVQANRDEWKSAYKQLRGRTAP